MSEAAHTPGPWKRMRGSEWGPDIPFDHAEGCTWINLGPSDDGVPVAIVITDEDDADTPRLVTHANLIAAAPDLKSFADSVLIYQIEGDEEHVWLRFGGQNICIMKANSAEGVALLKMESDRRAAIAKAEGRS